MATERLKIKTLSRMEHTTVRRMYMYLISLKIQQARSKLNPDKPGKLYLRITERNRMGDGAVESRQRSVSTDIPVPVDSHIQDLREDALPYVYSTYLVIDKLRKSGSAFTIDEVCEQLRAMFESGELKHTVNDDFVWNTEVATLKKELIPLFRYNKKFRQRKAGEVSEESVDESESLTGFLYAMSRKMLSEGRESTSNSYMSTRLSLKRFLDDEDIPLADIDHNFIESYAEWLKENGVTESTRSFYLRTLRSGINYAVKEGLADSAKDLFRNVSTQIRPDKTGGESARLSREAIMKIASMDLSDSPKLDLARDMFMFGFYCRGMELTDIINLRAENLRDNELTFRRRGVGKEMTLRLDPQAMAILKKYDSRRLDFLFPVKTSSMMKLDKTLKYQVTTWLDAVGKKAGLDSLKFKMNISTWNYLMSQANISSVLLGT